MKTFIDETRAATDNLRKLLDQYEAKQNKIDNRLKPEIVQEERAKMESEFRKPMMQAHDALSEYLDKMKDAAETMGNPLTRLLLRVTGPTIDPDNEAMFFSNLFSLMSDMQVLMTCEEKIKSPAVVLAGALTLRDRGFKDEDGRLHELALKFMPVQTFQGMRGAAKNGYDVLIRHLNLTGGEPQRRLHLGHLMREFEHILERAQNLKPSETGRAWTGAGERVAAAKAAEAAKQ